jgi:hypothetical protein
MKTYGLTPEQLAMVSVVQRQWAAQNPRAILKTPLTVEDVLNSRRIAYPYRKWPAVLMLSKHREICHIRMLCTLQKQKIGSRGHAGERYISRDNRFQITIIPRIRPDLVQKKQVDQANENQRQVVGDPAGRISKVHLNGGRCRRARFAE